MESAPSVSIIHRFGMFEVDRRTAELRRRGSYVRLQPQPLQILLLLLDRAGEPVSREQLRLLLWPDETVVDFDRNLNKAMNKLRQALGDTADNPRFIETVHRRGYRFIAPVSSADYADERPGAIDVEHGPGTASADGPSLTPQSSASMVTDVASQPPDPETTLTALQPPAALLRETRFTRGLVVAAVLCALLLAAAGLVFWRDHTKGSLAAETAGPVSQRSIAILRFQNLSGDSRDAWLATALADWLATDLSADGQLRAASPDSVAVAEKELALVGDSAKASNAVFLGRILGTKYVVSGTYGVLRGTAETKIRLDFQLKDAGNGQVLASMSNVGSSTDLLSLVSRAGLQLRGWFGVSPLTQDQTQSVGATLPGDPEAARAYVQGVDAMRVFDARTATPLLQRSIALDPKFALSHFVIATAWEQLGYDALARKEADAALKLAGRLPRAEHLMVEGRDAELSENWNHAIDIFRALVQFYPENLDYGLALMHAQVSGGRASAALLTLARLRRLPAPMRDDARLDLAEDWAAEALGNYEMDLKAAQGAAGKARNMGATLLLAQALADQQWALENLGRRSEALADANQSLSLFSAAGDLRGVSLETGAIGLSLLEGGHAAEAIGKFKESLAIHQRLGGSLAVAGGWNNIGEAQVALGMLDQAQKSYTQSLRSYQDTGHEDGVALAKNSLGSLYLTRGDTAKAISSFGEALSICRRLGDQSKASDALLGLGEAYRSEGDLDRAHDFQQQALAGFEQIADADGTARVRLSMARTLVREGDLARAEKEARQAQLVFEAEQSPAAEAMAGSTLAAVLLSEHRLEEARRTLAAASHAAQASDDVEAHQSVECTQSLLNLEASVGTVHLRAAAAVEALTKLIADKGFVADALEVRRFAGSLGSPAA
jgi:DNA-binding winged helix-turn-helix (wHTH) protein/tetratricopeptide (TPR) repeat protein/TolB-like protein